MKLTADITTNLNTQGAIDQVNKAGKKALMKAIVAIAGTVIKEHPWKTQTGNNSRSIMYEVGPGGEVAKNELEGAVYSTSGYGGWLEVGHGENPHPRPYFKPALDRNKDKLPQGIKSELG